MNFTDLFIRNPVYAIVVTVAIMVVGIRSVASLPVLQYPQTESAVVTVTTIYYGADADTIAGFITTPIENAMAQAQGIDYMTSSSSTGVSTVTANLQLNYDSHQALTEISIKVNSVINQLPTGTLQPIITVSNNAATDAMYIGFYSESLAANGITDYLVRVVQPRLQAIAGVQQAEFLGSQNFAIRAWLDPIRMAAFGLTANDVSTAIAQNNYVSGLGNTKGQMIQVTLTAGTVLHSLAEFRDLVVRQANGAIVRLRDVATVTLGGDSYDTTVWFDGVKSVYIGIKTAPAANLLTVVRDVRKVFPDIQADMPGGLTGAIIYDASTFVKTSLVEVVYTLLEALAIVTAVVFLFLGSPRSVLIPVIAIPVSLIGTFAAMLAFGFSINLLSLLALVLAIGLVVDDVIIVVENVERHIALGTAPLPATIAAARELGRPIIAMTVVLIAVYVPIGFQGGLTGALFTEFAFTLASAVTLSGVVALTLSPMMCSRLLRPASTREHWSDRLGAFLVRQSGRIERSYERRLRSNLRYRPVTYVLACLVLGSIYFLYAGSTGALAPDEDQGIILTSSLSAPDATLDQRELYSRELYRLMRAFDELDHAFQLDVPGVSISGLVLKPWDERTRTAAVLQPAMQTALNGIAGERVVAYQPPTLPGSSGLPVLFAIVTTNPFTQLEPIASSFLEKAQKSGLFAYIDSDLKIDQPQSQLSIDRDKAALLGTNMSSIGASLAWMLGGGYVNYFSMEGRSYKVIPQVERAARLNPSQILDYYVQTGSGTAIPLATLSSLQPQTVPESLNHFQQLNSATISAVPLPGVSLGDALGYLRDLAQTELPPGYRVDYGGQSRQYVVESRSFAGTFGFALVVIFLALAAQFNSFRDPPIILVSVPMSVAGALLFINLGLGGVTLNIYTEVGLVTLIGLISKHGILIIEFANSLQRSGVSKLDAVVGAACTRLRPILMTTAAMVLGVLPLVFATGAGAMARFNMGLVIATGISIGTLFTLFVVPATYVLIAERLPPEAAAVGAHPEPGQTK